MIECYSVIELLCIKMHLNTRQEYRNLPYYKISFRQECIEIDKYYKVLLRHEYRGI